MPPALAAYLEASAAAEVHVLKGGSPLGAAGHVAFPA